uniref:Transmembrane protein n=1 Tax=Rhipicephalus pulchellus TaxID=72859 RepID=L7LVH4_RHIPC
MKMSPRPSIDFSRDRFPFCIVWTPIPCLTWLCPLIGHMGICMSSGVIRDFAGPYYVSEDSMAFGRPTKYWMLDPSKARDGVQGWDRGVTEGSEEYRGHMHNLFCDNCHSHVARCLNLMQYGGSTRWNMVKLAIMMPLHSKYVSTWALIRTWLPSVLLLVGLLLLLWLVPKA